MFTATQLLQISVALIPMVGLLVISIDRMSSQKSITMRSIIKVMGLALVPAIVILALQGLFSSPMVSGFFGLMAGFILANLVASD